MEDSRINCNGIALGLLFLAIVALIISAMRINALEDKVEQQQETIFDLVSSNQD